MTARTVLIVAGVWVLVSIPLGVLFGKVVKERAR